VAACVAKSVDKSDNTKKADGVPKRSSRSAKTTETPKSTPASRMCSPEATTAQHQLESQPPLLHATLVDETTAGARVTVDAEAATTLPGAYTGRVGTNGEYLSAVAMGNKPPTNEELADGMDVDDDELLAMLKSPVRDNDEMMM